ncbi:hypothetical protein ACFW5V_31380 [Streptomyces sp. NPDC058762]|uniref:hypothetical protein n=1 Tax=Streptomyces sp. NPDC058762 TaxID=3346629 RepID=UPI0036C2D27B
MPDDLQMGRTEEYALAYAKEWAQLPPQHLRVALKSLEPMMLRHHELALTREKNKHRMDLLGLVAGFVVSLVSLGAAAVFGFRGDYWMAGIMLSPSVFAVTKLFVLRKSNGDDMRRVSSALGAVTQPGGPPPLSPPQA